MTKVFLFIYTGLPYQLAKHVLPRDPVRTTLHGSSVTTERNRSTWRKPTMLRRVKLDILTKISRHFTCEKHMELEHFHLWNFHSTYEIGMFSHMKYLNSRMKSTNSKFHMWNVGAQDMYFTCELEYSHAKNNFTYKIVIHTWNWNNSHMKYYFHKWNCIENFWKGNKHFSHVTNTCDQ